MATSVQHDEKRTRPARLLLCEERQRCHQLVLVGRAGKLGMEVKPVPATVRATSAVLSGPTAERRLLLRELLCLLRSLRLLLRLLLLVLRT